MKLNCGAERIHYSMFSVGRSMFDVHFFSKPTAVIRRKLSLALMRFILVDDIFDANP
jgi:hypothetical protein